MPLDFLKSPAAQLAAKILGGGAVGAGVLGGLGEFNNNDQDPARRSAQRKRNLLLGAALGGLGGGAWAGYDKLVKPELNKPPVPENPYDKDRFYMNEVKAVADFPKTVGVAAGVAAKATQEARNLKNMVAVKSGRPDFLIPHVIDPGVLPVTPYVPGTPPVHPGPVTAVKPLPHAGTGNLPGAPMPTTFTPLAIANAEAATIKLQRDVDTTFAKLLDAHRVSEAKRLADHGANAAKAQAEATAKYTTALAAAETAKKAARDSVVSMSGLTSRGTEGWKHMYDQMSIHPDQLANFAKKEFSHLPLDQQLPAAKAHVKNMMEIATANTPAAKLVENALIGQMGNFNGPLISRKLVTDPAHLLGHSAAYWRSSPRARILATALSAAGLTETVGRTLRTNATLPRWWMGREQLDNYHNYIKNNPPISTETTTGPRVKLEIK